MTHDDVQAWLDRYVEAWRTYDPARSATSSPRTPPTAITRTTRGRSDRGRDAIVADWHRDRDQRAGSDGALRAVRWTQRRRAVRGQASAGAVGRTPVRRRPSTTTSGSCTSTATAAARVRSSTSTSCRSASARAGCRRRRSRPHAVARRERRVNTRRVSSGANGTNDPRRRRRADPARDPGRRARSRRIPGRRRGGRPGGPGHASGPSDRTSSCWT